MPFCSVPNNPDMEMGLSFFFHKDKQISPNKQVSKIMFTPILDMTDFY